MGQVIRIKTKDNANLNKLNASLEKMGLENAFLTPDDLINWVDSINNDPNSPQKHLKEKDVVYTIADLKKQFPYHTIVGQLDFDVAFGRTSEEDVKKYAQFITRNKVSIEHIKGGDSLIERYELTPKQIETIEQLTHIPEPPKLLPVEEQRKPNIQSGLFLCKSFSIEPFWLLFGKVESPTFLKVKTYVDDINNKIYRDKKGLSYLMIPLLPMSDNINPFLLDVYEKAYDMGLRESFGFIMSLIYGIEFVHDNDMVEDLKNFYTVEELKERLITVATMYLPSKQNKDLDCVEWNGKKFIPVHSNYGNLKSKCHLLNALVATLPKEDVIEITRKVIKS